MKFKRNQSETAQRWKNSATSDLTVELTSSLEVLHLKPDRFMCASPASACFVCRKKPTKISAKNQ